jgi:hypothetical protein
LRISTLEITQIYRAFPIDPGQLEQTDDALRIELTRERFGNLVAFRIGRSPKRFWCWERAISVEVLEMPDQEWGIR